MSYQLLFTHSYNKRVKQFLTKHSDLKGLYQKTLQLLEHNPFHPSLRLHSLSGKLKGVHSVSINISYRITLELLIDDQKIIPIAIGTHDELYR